MPKSLRIPVTGGIIQSKALEIRDFYLKANKTRALLSSLEKAGLESFTASQQWCSKMMIAGGWNSRTLHGEAGSVDVEAAEPEMEKIRAAVQEYGLEFTYNMDETGLFFKLLPNRAYVKNEETKVARGTKLMKAKDRVTVYVCTNGDGTDLVPLSIIGTAKKPRCFKNGRKKLKYYNQKKAWSDTKAYKKWFRSFCNHVAARTTSKVLLLADNCGPHGTDVTDPTGQVKVMFLPPNCTAVFQPMDCGVIAMLKKLYRYELLCRFLLIYEEHASRRLAAQRVNMASGTKGLEQGYTPHLRDVMDILHGIWRRIRPEDVRNCWIKSTVTQPPAAVPPPLPVADAAEGATPAANSANERDESTNTAPDSNICTTDVPKYSIGTAVSREFEDDNGDMRPYAGVVASIDIEEGCNIFYTIKYDDGNQEDIKEVLLADFVVAPPGIGGGVVERAIENNDNSSDAGGSQGSDNASVDNDNGGGEVASEFFGEERLTGAELESVKLLSSEVAAGFFVAASGNEEAAETEHQRTDIYQQDEAQNDFDWAVREMALTIQAAGRVEEAIDSWIDTENTKHAIAARVEEVEKEISTEMLCGLDVPETETNVVESGKQLDGAA